MLTQFPKLELRPCVPLHNTFNSILVVSFIRNILYTYMLLILMIVVININENVNVKYKSFIKV